MPTKKPARRGRPPKPGMVTKTLRLPVDMYESLKALAEKQSAKQPVDRSPVMWTDVTRDFLRRGLARAR